MKYNFCVLSKINKDTFYKINILSLILLLVLLFVLYFNFGEINSKYIVNILGISIFKNGNFLFMIWAIFQISITVYFSYTFYSYEIDNSLEFILLRKSLISAIINKIAVCFFVVALFRVIMYTILSIILNNYSNLDIILFTKNIAIYMVYSLLTLIFVLFNNYKIFIIHPKKN